MALTAQKRNVHFIGIGGIGMSGLAEILMELGHQVSGSDLKESETTLRLSSLGAQIQIGHAGAIVERLRPDVVVYSTAVGASNPEIEAAKKLHIPIIRRAEMLGELMRLKRGVAVAGSHGKTTTTAMLGLILKSTGADPTLVIGGRFDAIGSNAAWGRGELLIAEADESDGTFLKLMPEYCVVTNIDAEHLDHYGDFSKVCQAFTDFLDHVPFYGKAVLCSDCSELRNLSQSFNKPRIWYGFLKDRNPDYLLEDTTKGLSFSARLLSRSSGFKDSVLDFELSVPGKHNLLNAAGAALLALELGAKPEVIAKALKSFTGVRRRFEFKGTCRGVSIFEDYAHHPTEIKATLSAARSVFPNSKIAVLFQPHRYSRTRQCWKEFATCFSIADRVLTTDVYPASEERAEWTKGFDGENFFKNIHGAQGGYCSTKQDALLRLQSMIKSGELESGDCVFVLGAGDINSVAKELVCDA